MKLGISGLKEVYGNSNLLAVGALFLLARFLLSLLLMPLLIPRSIRALDASAWKLGFWLSIVFSAGSLAQVFGLAHEALQPGQSAFLTSLYVVATPLIGAAIYRKLPPAGVMIGLPFALVGAAYIAGPIDGGLSVAAWSTVLCAAIFGGHIMLTDYATRRADPMAITFTMLVFSTLWMGLALVLAPGGAAMLDLDRLARACTQTAFLPTLIPCAVFATVIALAVLNRWQKELHPSRAAIVYTMEPVFAAMISVSWGSESLTGWLVFGAAMILVANFAAGLIARRPASND